MDAVAEVKSRINIEDLIGEYVRLKRAGRNFKGLSPFTNEKTASFIVSPEKQIWHDFSASRGGDIFTFVMEVEGLDFKGALDLLAQKAGVDLDKYKTGTSRGPKKEKLYQALELAAKFYQVQLKNKPGALDYIFKKRGFSKATALDFQLGYSPDNLRGLTDFLLKKGFSEQEIKQAGLSTIRSGKPIDMFRGRIMVPLSDQAGKVIGFTARLLNDNPDAPKYINTPQTVLYDKSRHVFGLHLAKKAIRESKIAVIVEGNMDVVASHQVGVANVVATAGTAMTEMQLKALSRLTTDVRLAFDQDRAGLSAAERAIPIASKAGVNLGIITLTGAKDPDELIQKDPKLWQSAIANHQYAFDWLVDRYKAQLDLGTAQGKREFSDVLLPVVRGLSDSVEKEHYLKKIAEHIDVSVKALQEKLTQKTMPEKVLKSIKPIVGQPTDTVADKDWQRAADRLLCLALMLPGTRGYLDVMSSEMFESEQSRKVFEFLASHPEFDGDLSKAPELKTVVDYVKILSLQFEELYGDVDMLELQYEATRLRAKVIHCFVKHQKKLISAKLQTNQTSRSLLKQSRDLDNLLKR